MRALAMVRKGSKSQFELVDVPEPDMGNEEIKIRIEKCGICGSDLRAYLQGPTPWGRVGVSSRMPPIWIRGHEFTGTVIAVGRSVEDFKEGDRVVVDPSAKNACGTCLYCRIGEHSLCRSRWSWDERVSYGGFARYYVIKPDWVSRLPEKVSFSDGVFCEPLAVCVRGVCQQCNLKPGDFAVISGPGALGLLALQIVKLQGAKAMILGLDRDKQRLKVARDLGADWAASVDREDVKSLVEHLTKGKGADVVFECAGSKTSVEMCLQLVGWNGQLIEIGVLGTQIEMNYDTIVLKNLRVQGCYGHNWQSWSKGLDLLEEGTVRVQPLVGAEMPITQWKEAFEKMSRDDTLPILLFPVE